MCLSYHQNKGQSSSTGDYGGIEECQTEGDKKQDNISEEHNADAS